LLIINFKSATGTLGYLGFSATAMHSTRPSFPLEFSGGNALRNRHFGITPWTAGLAEQESGGLRN
jgi:hypothetical protein